MGIITDIFRDFYEAVADFEKNSEEQEENLRGEIGRQQATIERQKNELEGKDILIGRQDAEIKRLLDEIRRLRL
jgi:hypothetical protein